jgi:hypothetical protein
MVTTLSLCAVGGGLLNGVGETDDDASNDEGRGVLTSVPTSGVREGAADNRDGTVGARETEGTAAAPFSSKVEGDGVAVGVEEDNEEADGDSDVSPMP